MKNILILGAGEIGTAFGHLLKKKKDLTISLWDKNPQKVPDQKNLLTLLPEADFIFLCISSWALMPCTEQIKKHIKPQAILVSPTKGIQKETKKFVGEFLAQEFPSNPVAMIAGPMLGEEIIQDLPAKALCATDNETFANIKGIFKESGLVLEHSPDIYSTCIASVLKNIYAVSLGIFSALDIGDNAKGAIITHAIQEMEIILTELNGNLHLAHSLAGIGDLVTTGYSDYSRNRTTGKLLVETGDYKSPGEGIHSLPSLLFRLGDDFKLPPILNALKKVLVDKEDVKKTFLPLLQ